MTLALVLSTLAVVAVVALVLDWRRTSRLKKQLSDGTATELPSRRGRDATADPAIAQATAEAVARGVQGGGGGGR